eukprot:2634802-Pyramimonas_sp.AAC.1
MTTPKWNPVREAATGGQLARMWHGWPAHGAGGDGQPLGESPEHHSSSTVSKKLFQIRCTLICPGGSGSMRKPLGVVCDAAWAHQGTRVPMQTQQSILF